MTTSEALEKLLPAFYRYYTVKREDVTEPFAAEAEFCSHDTQFFLVKSAKLSESDSREFVFFATEEMLDADRLKILDETAWNTGMSRVEITPTHRSSDVSLFIIADKIAPDAAALIKKMHHYKSYSHMLKGWSKYSLIALELSTGNVIYNHQGQELKKLIRNIQK